MTSLYNYRLLKYFVTVVVFLFFFEKTANAVVIGFDDLADGTELTTQYESYGVIFDGGLVFKTPFVYAAGISLNESEFPPYSGINVLIDQNGPISGHFLSPVNTVSARFTYATPVTLRIFDRANALVGVVSSSHDANFVSSGNPTGELLELTFLGGIERFEIIGDIGGFSFSLDDLSFDTITSVPETLPLWFGAMGILFPPMMLRWLSARRRAGADR